MDSTIDILKTAPEERNTGTWEQYYMYKFKRAGLTIIRQYTSYL
jgi:hypothetical protein